MSKLRAYHNAALNEGADERKRALKYYGLELINGEVRDNLNAGVLEPAMSKIRSLKSATEAAIAILRIDDMIKGKEKGWLMAFMGLTSSFFVFSHS